MAPRLCNKRFYLEYNDDLIKSIADIANVTPSELIKLLQQPEHPQTTTIRHGISPKSLRRHRKRPTRRLRQQLYTNSWAAGGESSWLSGSRDSGPSKSRESGFDPETHLGYDDTAAVCVLNDPVANSWPTSRSCRPLEACHLCPGSVAQLDINSDHHDNDHRRQQQDHHHDQQQQETYLTESTNQMSCSGPDTLSEYMDYLHPDLAYCNVITVQTAE